ncbi:DUF3139 domain-containing protein [Staphylococcus pettenkoferi]|uniref:DUF3139 domain-containing protein n=1 Tax=Staphylococcus pettenkoferi TaxID=170573 RepID=UPI0022755307|nr:DUF3139 domain-containing protein [Staphylococcus pettenkoferi]MCY1585108.1 DUF3139 domain-containing protein [Staphylococcus pettenkoferi]
MKKKPLIIGITTFIIVFVVIPLTFVLGLHIYSNYHKHEEAKTKAKVHRVLKDKGWENKIKTEKGFFTLNTGDNDVEVTYKDDPYNVYQYDVDDNGKVTGDAVLKEKYDKKPKGYKKPYEIK